MRRETRFLASRALYAVDLSGLSREQVGTIHGTDTPLYSYEIPAVWFKRRNGINTANIGTLWTISPSAHTPHDEVFAPQFMQYTLTDGRYGGRCRTRWDGEYLWSDPATTYTQQRQDAEFLERMLSRYPDIPEGFDGWWRF